MVETPPLAEAGDPTLYSAPLSIAGVARAPPALDCVRYRMQKRAERQRAAKRRVKIWVFSLLGRKPLDLCEQREYIWACVHRIETVICARLVEVVWKNLDVQEPR